MTEEGWMDVGMGEDMMRGPKIGSEPQRRRQADAESGHVDMGRGMQSVGQTGRLGLTYRHYYA